MVDKFGMQNGQTIKSQSQIKHERSQSQVNKGRFSQQTASSLGFSRPQTANIKKQLQVQSSEAKELSRPKSAVQQQQYSDRQKFSRPQTAKILKQKKKNPGLKSPTEQSNNIASTNYQSQNCTKLNRSKEKGEYN